MNRKTTKIDIGKLEITQLLQPRAGLDRDTVEEYAQLLRDGTKLPPIECVSCGDRIYVTDGFHRIEGAKLASIDRIDAVVVDGTWSQAIWAAAGANRTHGLKRSTADKRRATAMVLADANFAMLSDREIAKHVGVTHPFVAAMRKRMAGEDDAVETEAEADPAEIADERQGSDPDASETESVEERMKAAKKTLATLGNSVACIEAEAKDLLDNRPEASAFLSRSILSDIKNLAAAIRFAMPAQVCPYCHGEGCDACKGQGWVGKLYWDTAVPAELKG